MKKIFTYLLFTFFILNSNNALSGVRSASEPFTPKTLDIKKVREDTQKLYKEIPDINNKEAIQKYLEKRIKIVSSANLSEEEIASPSSTSIVDPQEIRKKQESTLSAYEKIYQDSLARTKDMSHTLNEELKLEGVFYRPIKQNQSEEKFIPNFPYVTIKLSDQREIIAPAEEHIAYLLSMINIDPTGLIDLTEEFVFVSNNESFPQGFIRILPKYTYSPDKQKRRIDFTLKSVTINDKEYAYKVTEVGNYLYIEPKTPINIPAGIHTYRFNYLIDRLIWNLDEFDELTWNITAKTLKNVVGSANAIVSLPSGRTFAGQNAIVSKKTDVDANRVTITNLSESSLGFADTEALDLNEDMHIFITLPKETLITPDFTKRYLWFIQDYGANIFALLALLAIFCSYKISAIQIHRNKDKTQVTLKRTPSIYRMLNTNLFDKYSFGGELLNLCNKNITELQPRGDSAILIKKTDNTKNLNKKERNLLKILFPNTETSLIAEDKDKLKIIRAYKYLRMHTIRTIEIYKLKLNSLYLTFSISMLVCGIIASSSIAVNPKHTLLVILGCSIILFPLIALFNHHLKNKVINLLVKLIMLLLIIFIAGTLAIYTSNFYSITIILSIYIIISYYSLFSRRSGLLKNKIKETEEYKSFLQKNTEISEQSKDFKVKMPYIYAFNLENKYKESNTFKLLNHFTDLLTNKH